jgi:hypothetical protein
MKKKNLNSDSEENNSVLNMFYSRHYKKFTIKQKIFVIPQEVIENIFLFKDIYNETDFNDKASTLAIYDNRLLNIIFMYLITINANIFKSCNNLYDLLELIKISEFMGLIHNYKHIYYDLLNELLFKLDDFKNDKSILDVIIFLYNKDFQYTQNIHLDIINECFKIINESSIDYKLNKDIPFKILVNSTKLFQILINDSNEKEILDYLLNHNLEKIYFLIALKKLLKYRNIKLNFLQQNTQFLSKIIEFDALFDLYKNIDCNINEFLDNIHESLNNSESLYTYLVTKLLFGNNIQKENIKEHLYNINELAIEEVTSKLLLKLTCEEKVKIIKNCNKELSIYLINFFLSHNSFCLCIELH